MKKFSSFLFSMLFTGILIVIFAIAIAYATFIENDYGATTAKILIDASTPNVESMEGYHLSVTPTAITITAKTKVGAFYGMQTLLQLEAQSKNIPVL